MDQPLDSGLECLSCQPLGTLDVQGMKSLRSVFDVKTDRIHHTVSASKRMRDRLFVMNIRFDRLKLRIIKSKQPVSAIRVPRCNPNRKPMLTEMSNDAAAEKPGSAEHGDGALVRGHGSNSPAFQVPWTACLPTTVHDVGYLIQMGVDLVR